MNNCLIVCNGEISKKLLFRFLELKKLRPGLKIISCDGASDFLYRHKVTPHYIIGDLDSVKPETLSYYKGKKVIVRRDPDQNTTDLEKALKLALSKKFTNIFIIGLSGKRFDHSLNSLSILKRYYKKANIRIYDKTLEMFMINKSAEFRCKKGDVISLIPLPETKGVKTAGLKYPLNNEALSFGRREGALNEATGNYVKIEIKKGELLVLKKINISHLKYKN